MCVRARVCLCVRACFWGDRTNRFTNIQLHPSFWDGQTLALGPPDSASFRRQPSTATAAAECRSAAGFFSSSAASCPGPGNNLDAVGTEAALYFDKAHTVAGDSKLVPTTLIANLVIASFNDSNNFGHAGSMIGQSNGRAMLFAGDAGNLDINGLVMNNEQDSSTNLWAASEGSRTTMRVRGATLDYAMTDDFIVQSNATESAAAL